MSAVELLNRARDLLNQECEEEAIEALSEALKIQPGFGDAYLYRAEAYRLLRRYNLALVDYRKALETGGDAFKSWLGISICQFKQCSFDEADKSLGFALNANGESAEAYYWRGRAKMELKDLASAIAHLSIAVELDSVHQDAKAFLSLARSKQAPPSSKPVNQEVLVSSELFEHGHPRAITALKDKFFWSTDDYSPIGGDIGFDCREAVWDWRKTNREQTANDFLASLFEEWGYHAEEIQRIVNESPSSCTGELHTVANMYDDTAIAVAFAQFMLDGYLDSALGKLALHAASRQSKPEVLEFRATNDEYYVQTRMKIRDALLKMIGLQQQ